VIKTQTLRRELPGDIKINGYKAHIRYKKVSCGKPGCTKCPHGSYAYLVYRSGEKVKDLYLGAFKKKEYKNESSNK